MTLARAVRITSLRPLKRRSQQSRSFYSDLFNAGGSFLQPGNPPRTSTLLLHVNQSIPLRRLESRIDETRHCRKTIALPPANSKSASDVTDVSATLILQQDFPTIHFSPFADIIRSDKLSDFVRSEIMIPARHIAFHQTLCLCFS